MLMVRLAGFLLAASLSFAQISAAEQAKESDIPNAPLTADVIMARVAANQDHSATLRKQYVYRQHTHVLTHKPKGGRLLREETADYYVRVFTKLSRRIPFAVRTFLGTDLPGVGFNVVYKRQEDGVWFPATFGTEFRIRAIFFINRDVSVSLENTDFQHTHVESRMKVIGPVD
jgi:hypothetical protein